MTVENIMKLIDTVSQDAIAYGIALKCGNEETQERFLVEVKVSRAALLAAVEELVRKNEVLTDLAKDAERSYMLVLAVEDAMKNGVLPIDVEEAYAAMKGQS